MTCGDCFHGSVCGSSSRHCDVSQCKAFVNKNSVVSIDVLNSAHERYEKLREDARDIHFENMNLKERIQEKDDELSRLNIIKQTLEMASGLKFDFSKGD